MELNKTIYIGKHLDDKKRFAEIVDWCCDHLGRYGDDWRLDWEKQTLLTSEKTALLFFLRWA